MDDQFFVRFFYYCCFLVLSGLDKVLLFFGFSISRFLGGGGHMIRRHENRKRSSLGRPLCKRIYLNKPFPKHLKKWSRLGVHRSIMIFHLRKSINIIRLIFNGLQVHQHFNDDVSSFMFPLLCFLILDLREIKAFPFLFVIVRADFRSFTFFPGNDFDAPPLPSSNSREIFRYRFFTGRLPFSK